jgi:NAD(P)-dependent dehydrogenase (short-subunit alcohol dehydrogenase family)
VRTALDALSEVLRDEVAGYGVDVVVVEPGAVRAPAWDQVASSLRQRREVALEPEVYDRGIELQDQVRDRAAGPEQVAEVVGTALRAAHPRFRYRTRTAAVPFALAARVVPTSVRDRVVRSLENL